MEFMENKVCLDSDFIIDFLRNDKNAIRWLNENSETEIVTTAISVFELYLGEYKSESSNRMQKLEEFIEKLDILILNREIAKKAAEVAAKLEKDGKMIDFRDILIGCIALTHKIPLKTNNKKHFERIVGLELI